MKDESSFFVMFPTRYLETLTPRQSILMGVLIGMAKKEGYAYPSNQTLSSIINVSIDSIQRDLQFLEENNYIIRQIIRNEKKEIVDRRIFIKDLTAELPIPLTAELRLPSPQNCDSNSNKKDNNNINIDLPQEYLESFNKWIQYKKEKKQKYGKIGMNTLIQKIKKEFKSPRHFDESVEHCISANYSGLFPIKEKEQPVQPINNTYRVL